MPAITVVMPVYNRADNVREAIASLLTQDFTDFELIVVDDGSQDGTADVVEAIPDPRIRCLHQPQNHGGNAARNIGIRESDSPLICLIDSDDQFLPGKLSFLAGYFDRNPKIDVLIDSFRLVYPPEMGKAAVDRINPDLASSADVEQAVFARRLKKPTPAISARRDALIAAGCFDETLTRRQDMDMILRLARSAHCASTSQILWIKHWSTDSITAVDKTFPIAVIEICERHPDYLSRPEFRVGLALDIARHFLRLVAKGRISAARRDIRRWGRFFGWPRLAGLLGAGMVEVLHRRAEQRAR